MVHVDISVVSRRPEVAIRALIADRAIDEDARERGTESVLEVGVIARIGSVKGLVFPTTTTCRHTPAFNLQ